MIEDSMMGYEEFKAIPKGEVFRVVTTKYHTFERVNGQWPELTFVCVKGEGEINDWAIYAHYPDRGVDWIKEQGDKVTSSRNIQSIFPCTDDVMRMYRR